MRQCKKELTDVWRALNKIRAAVFRVNLDLWKYFKPLDPEGNNLTSESNFVGVLSGVLRGEIGLSDQEIAEITDYFRVQDGRIFYGQFCSVIHDNVPDFEKNLPLVSGHEWEDPFHVNALSVTEERRLKILLTKIATAVNMRKLVLRPYFQDYELLTKNEGVVTVSHFARILAHLRLLVADVDFHLLLKKFMKSSYTVNYVAFLEVIDRITKTLTEQQMLDVGGDLIARFPTRCITAALPKLPRPEVGHIALDTVFGPQAIFHPVSKPPADRESLHRVLRRIQQYVWRHRIRVAEFFKDFDPLRSGRVTKEQFRRCLDAMGLAGTQRLYLAEPDIEIVTIMYTDPNDEQRVIHTAFTDDIEHVFSARTLEKTPTFEVDSPGQEVRDVEPPGRLPWLKACVRVVDLCEDAVEQLKHRVRKRRINLRPIFHDYDPLNKGHVTRAQFRQCLVFNSLLPPKEHLYALEQRFSDDMGVDYYRLLREVEPGTLEEPLYNDFFENRKLVNWKEWNDHPERREKDIVWILAKIKAKVVRERVRIKDALHDYDNFNHSVIMKEDFERVLNVLNFGLTKTEIATLCDVFGAVKRPGWVDYVRFNAVVDEALTVDELQRAPLITPLQHVPPNETNRNFMNYEERALAGRALEKLARKPHQNLEDIFKDYDHENIGSVTQEQFTKALALRNMLTLLSMPELAAVQKSFGVERGLRDEVDYRAFKKALDIIFANNKRRPV
ncbi:uncharacterized protein LOC117640356 [Thrips palmi]|uniref:Uncharacterized protein LOC117640356 n=1 Tax=Thrips palmi TaxID=161013 RepID=A0A6P8Y9A9_THRPL|nr:uncharacterized protein LOC117640356 [Thrips palmi]